MVYKLAITISGAVSLGTFESGALFEVLETIARHNEQIDASRGNANERIEVDVLTGASAGGMTACIAARKLLYEGDDLRAAQTNSFYGAWVKDVDLDGLLKLKPDENPNLSILSSDLVSKIAQDYLQKPLDEASKRKHPACADTLRLGLALSNLTGVDYSVPMFGGNVCDLPPAKNSRPIKQTKDKVPQQIKQLITDEFVYTRFQDEYTEQLMSSRFDADKWNEISIAAVSCGAFPFAFRPVERDVPDSHYWHNNDQAEPAGSHTYLFTDGGVFQNEPLGLAKNLVDLIDPNHEDNDSRYYLYIAPGAKTSSRDGSPLSKENANSINMARTLLKAIFNQARFHDWVMAENTNQQVLLLDQRAAQLKNLLITKRITLSPRDINNFTMPFLDALYENKADQANAKKRLERQYASDLKDFKDADLGLAWIRIVQLLEQAADLGDRDQMKIFGITADESELAGGKIVAFQGFFAAELRQHDYNYGRKKAREILRQLGIFSDVIPPDDSDITIDHGLDDFDALRSERPEYRALLKRVGKRSVQYVAGGVSNLLQILIRSHPWVVILAIAIVIVLVAFISQHYQP